MGKSVVVLGAQWGDEGKGKIVDLLTDRVKYVVRYQGGHNAGHTLIINGEKTLPCIRKHFFHSIYFTVTGLRFSKVLPSKSSTITPM